MHKVRINPNQQIRPAHYKEDQLIETMGHSLSYLVLGVLEGKFDDFAFREKRIQNLFDFVQIEKQKWHDNGDDALIIFDDARTVFPEVYASCKRITLSQYMRLAEIKPGKGMSKSPNIRAYLEGGYCLIGVWMCRALKDHYRFSQAKREEFFHYLEDWIDSYQRGYLDNEGIREMFIEDIKYDLKKGEKVK